MDRAKLADGLLSTLAARCPAAAYGWLAGGARRKDGDVAAHFAAAGRRIGRDRLAPTGPELEVLAAAGLDWSMEEWTLDAAARSSLILSAACRLPQARLETLIAELYRFGDGRERAALMRALPLLPEPARLLPLARRTAQEGLDPDFRALARDNPYPGRHFPDEALEQLALKADARGIPAARVLGLDRRRGAKALIQEAGRAAA